MLSVLVVSAEDQGVAEALRLAGCAVIWASPERAASGEFDLALLDLGQEGWQARLLEMRQSMPVIAFSSPSHVAMETAIEAMRLGAVDYLPMPLDVDKVAGAVNRHNRSLHTAKSGFDEIIGSSSQMREVFGIIKKAATSESNVLITGESGTGKELMARAIHRWSPRNDRPFVTINCSAIPDTLLESELFGFERGAFTGANYTKKGLLEIASGGTVFLDEIGDVSPSFQVKILRTIQEGEILRVGGAGHISIDVRIIAATNRDLRAACQKGSFREDFYYRLSVINIHMPPLREHKNDIPMLVRHFISKHSSKRKDLHIKGISNEAMRFLHAHDFPGNVRELENIIERAISFSSTPEILASDLPPDMRHRTGEGAGLPKLRDTLRAYEKNLIASAINECGGNISKAANELGVYRQQLQRKIKEYML